MRKNYISSDFIKQEIHGINTILEKSNFFSSTIVDIPEYVVIDNDDVIWFDNYNNEQTDFNSEISLPSNIYSVSDDKFTNHRLYLNDNQTNSQLEYNTLWNLEINTERLLLNYIFSKLKESRTFDGLTNQMLDNINTNLFIESYIKENIAPKYRIEKIELFLNHLDIRNNIRYQNIWNKNIDKKYLYNKYSFNSKNNGIEISFVQNNSKMFIFEYYYSIYYKRI